MRVCLYCQRSLPENKRADAKYCDVNCRKNANRLKRKYKGGLPPTREPVFINPNARPPQMPHGKTLTTMNLEEFLKWLNAYRNVPQKVKEDLYAKWEAGQLSQEPKVTKREKESKRPKLISTDKIRDIAVAAARERAKRRRREESSSGVR